MPSVCPWNYAAGLVISGLVLLAVVSAALRFIFCGKIRIFRRRRLSASSQPARAASSPRWATPRPCFSAVRSASITPIHLPRWNSSPKYRMRGFAGWILLLISVLFTATWHHCALPSVSGQEPEKQLTPSPEACRWGEPLRQLQSSLEVGGCCWTVPFCMLRRCIMRPRLICPVRAFSSSILWNSARCAGVRTLLISSMEVT